MSFTEFNDDDARAAIKAVDILSAEWQRVRPDAPTAEDRARASEDEDNARKVRAKNAAAELALALALAKARAENEVRVKAENEVRVKAWDRARAVLDKAIAEAETFYNEARTEAETFYNEARAEAEVIYKKTMAEAEVLYKRTKAEAEAECRAAFYLARAEAKAEAEATETKRKAASYLAKDEAKDEAKAEDEAEAEAEATETKRKAASYLAWTEVNTNTEDADFLYRARARAAELDALARENRGDRPTDDRLSGADYDTARAEAVANSNAIQAKVDAAFARNNPREAGASKWDKAASNWIDANPDFKFEDLLAWDEAFRKQGKEARAEAAEAKRRAASYLAWTEAEAKKNKGK